MSERTFIDQINDYLMNASDETRKVIYIAAIVLAFFFLVEFDGFFGFILFVLLLVFANYVKKIKRKQGHKLPPTPQENVMEGHFTEHKEKKPDLPKLHPSYQEALVRLEQSEKQLNHMSDQLEAFLDDFFADSTISKDRFMSQVNKAKKVCHLNTEKASNAIRLFGDENKPSPTRQEVLDEYVNSSETLVKQINDVIDALLRTDLNNTKRSSDILDESLIQLRDITAKYEQ